MATKKRRAVDSKKRGGPKKSKGTAVAVKPKPKVGSNEERAKSCAERVQTHYESCIDDLRRLWAAVSSNEGDDREREKAIYELDSYALSFDYVAPQTFGKDQREGYFRYQISWGGPSDEFRIYGAEYNGRPGRIDYHFMDWFDGASVHVTGADFRLMAEVFYYLYEGGGQSLYEKSMEDFEWEPEDIEPEPPGRKHRYAARGAFTEEQKLRERLAQLREMTVERGCTPHEAATAAARAVEIERKLRGGI